MSADDSAFAGETPRPQRRSTWGLPGGAPTAPAPRTDDPAAGTPDTDPLTPVDLALTPQWAPIAEVATPPMTAIDEDANPLDEASPAALALEEPQEPSAPAADSETAWTIDEENLPAPLPAAADLSPAPASEYYPSEEPAAAGGAGDFDTILSIFDTDDSQPSEQPQSSDRMAQWRAAQQAREDRYSHTLPTEDTHQHTLPAAPAAAPATAPASAPATAGPAERPGIDPRTVQAITKRYADYDKLSGIVSRVLGLGQSGDPTVQGALSAMTLTRDPDLDRQQRANYERLLAPLMQQQHISITNPADAQAVFDIAYDELIGIGPLGPLWRDDEVTEIMVSGPDVVRAERNGQLIMTPARFRDLDHLRRVARELARKIDDRTLSSRSPMVGAQLPGARVQFVHAPIAAVSGLSVVIRKFRPLFGLPDLLRFGALNDDMAAFLDAAVTARANILVSGGTGTGKTTVVNALSSFIPDSERVITIEDALELQLTNSHVEPLLTKERSSADDTVIIGLAEILRATLRMRPDRIIVGEIRDGSGCSVMLQAANTGHDGTMTTVHANNPRKALSRLCTLLRQAENMSNEVAREEVYEAFDVVVQATRTRGVRYISDISVLVENADGRRVVQPIFSGHLPRGAERPVYTRAGSLGADTDLARRMHEAGVDIDCWSETTCL